MDHLLTEARNPASTNLDELTPLELVRLMNAEDAKVVPAVAAVAEALARAVEVVSARARAGGRLVYAGAGTSGRLGVLDASECPPTFRTPPGMVVGVIAGGPAALTTAIEGAEDQPELGERDLRAIDFGPRDVLVGIATSGRTPYVMGALGYARSLGAYTIGLACVSGSDLEAVADLMITPIVGPEVLTGSTRLKAGTATKLVLNTISTATMVRLGKTFGNLMVDLRATNTKLQARANRIVRHFTGLSAESAAELLRGCDWEVKTALVCHRCGSTPAEARRLLHEAGGHIGRSLAGFADRADADGAGANGLAHSGSTGELLVGVDGGGTRTEAILAESADDSPGGWRVVGRGQGGPSNMQAVGFEHAARSISAAVHAAFAAAGLPRRPARCACLGLAGAGREEDQARIRRWAADVGLAGEVVVTGDSSLLLAAGTPDDWGVALIAGTGSAVSARAPDGRTARAGGWGPLLGDEGSGYGLAIAGLRAVAAASDGRGEPTALAERLVGRMGLPDPQALIPALHGGGWDRARLAALSPVVLEAAAEGDPVAGGIVRAATAALAQTVEAASRQLGLHRRPFPLALAGGLLLSSPDYRRGVLEELAARGLAADPVRLVPEPAEGAVRIALRRSNRRDQPAPAL